jgi:hypothetical protein
VGVVIKKIGDNVIAQKSMTLFKQIARHTMAFQTLCSHCVAVGFDNWKIKQTQSSKKKCFPEIVKKVGHFKTQFNLESVTFQA